MELSRPAEGAGLGRAATGWRRPVAATAVVGVALLAQFGGGYLYGELRTPQAVRTQLARQGAADIVVHLGFTPEQYNLSYLQDRGVIVRSTGGTIYMRFVGPDDVRAIAGQYWVSSIDAWSGGAVG